MKLTISEFMTNTELNDWKVKNVLLDVKKIEFQIIIEGGYWFKDATSEPKLMEGGGIIRVRHYSSFEARYFVPQDRLWHTLDYDNLEMLDEINEKTYVNSRMSLAGHGKSGYWIEYLIKGGDFEISFEE